jgi:hypothetical protein
MGAQWVTILFYATFVLEVILKLLVRSLQEDSGEDLGSSAHIISTLTRWLVWPTLIISTLIFYPH